MGTQTSNFAGQQNLYRTWLLVSKQVSKLGISFPIVDIDLNSLPATDVGKGQVFIYLYKKECFFHLLLNIRQANC